MRHEKIIQVTGPVEPVAPVQVSEPIPFDWNDIFMNENFPEHLDDVIEIWGPGFGGYAISTRQSFARIKYYYFCESGSGVVFWCTAPDIERARMKRDSWLEHANPGVSTVMFENAKTKKEKVISLLRGLDWGGYITYREKTQKIKK